MNRLKETHRILRSVRMAERNVAEWSGQDAQYKKLKDIIPEPEPNSDVEIVRSLNKLLRNLDGEELPDDVIHRLYNLRNSKEQEAVQIIDGRIEESEKTSRGLTKTELFDPISKIHRTVTGSEKHANDYAVKQSREYLAREVLQ